jgi:hypothetical protein
MMQMFVTADSASEKLQNSVQDKAALSSESDKSNQVVRNIKLVPPGQAGQNPEGYRNHVKDDSCPQSMVNVYVKFLEDQERQQRTRQGQAAKP